MDSELIPDKVSRYKMNMKQPQLCRVEPIDDQLEIFYCSTVSSPSSFLKSLPDT